MLNIIKIENGKIISKTIIGRNTSLPAGSEFANVEIAADNGIFHFERLYIPDEFDIEAKAGFEVRQKYGKSLLIPDASLQKNAIAGFKEYYTYNSVDAFKYLYLPAVIFSILMFIWDKDISIIYMLLLTVSFIIRSFIMKKVGNLCLCVMVPTYIYVLCKYFRI